MFVLSLFNYNHQFMSEKVCCAGVQVCSTNDQAWVATPASTIEGSSLTIALAVPSNCTSKPINALRYLPGRQNMSKNA